MANHAHLFPLSLLQINMSGATTFWRRAGMTYLQVHRRAGRGMLLFMFCRRSWRRIKGRGRPSGVRTEMRGCCAIARGAYAARLRVPLVPFQLFLRCRRPPPPPCARASRSAAKRYFLLLVHARALSLSPVAACIAARRCSILSYAHGRQQRTDRLFLDLLNVMPTPPGNTLL